MYMQSLPNATATSQVLYLIKCQLPQAPEHMATTVWAIQADASVTLHKTDQPDQTCMHTQCMKSGFTEQRKRCLHCKRSGFTCSWSNH